MAFAAPAASVPPTRVHTASHANSSGVHAPHRAPCEDHGGQRRHQQQLDDARLGQRDVCLARSRNVPAAAFPVWAPDAGEAPDEAGAPDEAVAPMGVAAAPGRRSRSRPEPPGPVVTPARQPPRARRTRPPASQRRTAPRSPHRVRGGATPPTRRASSRSASRPRSPARRRARSPVPASPSTVLPAGTCPTPSRPPERARRQTTMVTAAR